MVKIENLNTKAKREILLKVANHIRSFAESEYEDEVDSELQVLIDYYLEPLSEEDYFGTEGWEHFFDV